MKTNESTYRMVDCVYLLCVFDVFLSAASGKEKVKNLLGTSGKKRPKKRVLKVVLLWTETGENTVVFPCGSVAIFGILSLAS